MVDPLVRHLEHTLLRADAGRAAVEEAAAVGRSLGVIAVCVAPPWASLLATVLRGSKTKVCCVVGFPTGAHASAVKAREASIAVDDGAEELDMVVRLDAIRDGDWRTLEADVRAVVTAAAGRPVKAILETSLWDDAQLARAARAAVAGGASWVKTSTGFAGAAATREAVRVLRHAVPPSVGVKASGGIRDRTAALAMLEAGADRIGCSATRTILEGAS